MEAAALMLLGALCWWISTLAAGGGAMVFLPAGQLLLAPRQLSPVIALASLTSSVQRCFLYRGQINLRVLAWNVPGLITGSIIGALLLKRVHSSALVLLVAAFLVATAVMHFTRGGAPSFRVALPHFGVASFVTAILSALIGAAGPTMNPFYANAGILKEEMIGTKAASTLVMQIAKLTSFAALGLLDRDVLIAGLWVAIGALAGNYLGKLQLARMSGISFERLVYVGVGAAGIVMAAKVVL